MILEAIREVGSACARCLVVLGLAVLDTALVWLDAAIVAGGEVG